jgi:SsrA-binding protein
MGEARQPTVKNREVYHRYVILETLECGIELMGTEVKSIREGKVSLTDAYAAVRDGELWLFNLHISPYAHGNRENHDPRRTRRLLAKRREIARLAGRSVEKGLTLVPTRLYFKNGRVKVEIAVARGKKLHDKREAEMKRTIDRETRAALGERSR